MSYESKHKSKSKSKKLVKTKHNRKPNCKSSQDDALPPACVPNLQCLHAPEFEKHCNRILKPVIQLAYVPLAGL